MLTIAQARKLLLMPFPCRWNAWIRDVTAKIEGGWLIRKQDV